MEKTYYTQTATWDGDFKYDFMYDGEDRNTFTKEEVALMMEKIDFAISVYDDPNSAIENAKDFIEWLNRDVLK